MASTPALTPLLVVSRRRTWRAVTGLRHRPPHTGARVIVGARLGRCLAVAGGSVVSHFEIRVALNFIASIDKEARDETQRGGDRKLNTGPKCRRQKIPNHVFVTERKPNKP